MTVLQQVNFYQLVRAAMKVEKYEASSRERFQKRKLSKGASSSSSKELQSPKLSQYRVRLQEVEDREVQWYLVLVEVFQLDKEKSQLIAIDDIWACVDY